MRHWPRIVAVIGLALAWVGLKLVWERWSGIAGGNTTKGFDLPEAKPYLYALIAVSVITVAYVIWPRKPLGIALTVAALVLGALALNAALDLYDTGGTFIEDAPGLGLWLSAGGALVLLVASRPQPLAVGIGVIALLAIVFWPAGSLGGGRIEAVATEDVGVTMGLDGDTLLAAEPTGASTIYAFDPDGERKRLIFDLYETRSGFNERIDAIERAGDDLYVTITTTGLMKIARDGKARLLAVGPLPRPEDEPAGNPQRLPAFRPSRLAAATDGSLYILSRNHVFRYNGERVEPVATPELVTPQDIAVDGAGRLYIADTGNGRVLRLDRDGKATTLLGRNAAPRCVQAGQDEPESLDPARCHAVEAMAVDRGGNLFVATPGLPRVLALTTAGRYGVVAGTGLAGTAMGDGRAVSARLGAINKLAVGSDGALYIAEFQRALRVPDPLSGLSDKPSPAPAAPRAVCRAIAAWGTVDFRSKVTITERKYPNAEVLAAIDRLEGEDDLKRVLGLASEHNATVRELLQQLGDERCGLFDGLYPLPEAQAKRYCATYLREWYRFTELAPGDDKRDLPAARSARLLPEQLFPRDEIRSNYWKTNLHNLSDEACASPYRWATNLLR